MFFKIGIKKREGGYVYVAESTRKDGSKKIYTGMTRRSLWTRWGEHMRGKGGKYTSGGKWFKPLGGFWSSNPRKAEKTIKQMSPRQKRALGKYVAKKHRKTNWF